MLSGCLIGPNYRRPSLSIPESFHYEVDDAQPTLDFAWWQQFEDPVLDGLISNALLNNKNVQIAAANVLDAVGILIQTQAPLFPQVGYAGDYMRTLTSNSLATTSNAAIRQTPQTTWEAVINGSWQIDIWGRTRRLIESARATLNATYQERQAIILALVASVANSYIQLRSLDAQLEVSISTMESYGEAVKYFEAQFQYGQTSQITVAQAKTQYEIAAVTVPQIRLLIAQTENAISILLGQNPGPIPRGKTIQDLGIPIVPADLPSELLSQRPDIMQAEQNLIAANAQLGAAQALYFPTITLTEFYGNASQQLHHLFTGPARTWSFIGSITGPIFTAGAIYGQVVQAGALRQAALIGYKEAVQNAFADVEDALVARTMLIEQLEAQKRLVEAAGQYKELATLQYHGGYSPYFVVIQAQQQFFPAELSYVRTRGELLSSLVNIYQSMGGGWVCIATSLTNGQTWTGNP
jgi:multidrug efflux system outer membrane protein